MATDTRLDAELYFTDKVITNSGDDVRVVRSYVTLLASTSNLWVERKSQHIERVLLSKKLSKETVSDVLELLAQLESPSWERKVGDTLTVNVAVTSDLLWKMLRRPAQLRWLTGWLESRHMAVLLKDKAQSTKLLGHVAVARAKLPAATTLEGLQSWQIAHKDWFLNHRKRSLDYLIQCLSATAE